MNLAASPTSGWWCRTNFWNVPRACGIGDSAQNRAASVCSAVRVVLVLEPISCVSLKSRAQRLLESGGGPFGRNCSAEERLNGRMSGRYAPAAGVGAVGSHVPGIGGLGG